MNITTKAIKKIQKLENAGIFENIAGRTGSIEFKRYNLIYGFNGSGKTTFSRILASYETGELSSNLPADLNCELDCSFGRIKFEVGEKAFRR